MLKLYNVCVSVVLYARTKTLAGKSCTTSILWPESNYVLHYRCLRLNLHFIWIFPTYQNFWGSRYANWSFELWNEVGADQVLLVRAHNHSRANCASEWTRSSSIFSSYNENLNNYKISTQVKREKKAKKKKVRLYLSRATILPA